MSRLATGDSVALALQKTRAIGDQEKLTGSSIGMKFSVLVWVQGCRCLDGILGILLRISLKRSGRSNGDVFLRVIFRYRRVSFHCKFGVKTGTFRGASCDRTPASGDINPALIQSLPLGITLHNSLLFSYLSACTLWRVRWPICTPLHRSNLPCHPHHYALGGIYRMQLESSSFS